MISCNVRNTNHSSGDLLIYSQNRNLKESDIKKRDDIEKIEKSASSS
ncbi:MAG TPA: hypothetical protein VFC05_02445 [Nitrososphaeraceae archaeon]|nr:hypothetical protein [Nitrososphaeraceae archaeon]